MGFRCAGGSSDGGICALSNSTIAPMKQCPGGQCLSESVVSCEGQHILFGLPTMIQSLMLSTLIFFYALWVHKANGYFYRRRAFFLVAVVNGIYYVSFFLWVFLVRCGDSSGGLAQCSWCKTAMNAVTGFTLFVLSITLSHFSWKLYVHARSAPSSTVQAPSGRRKIISINMLIVFLFVSHGILSFFGLSPDRQDVLPCPLLLFPHAIICIVAEVFPALLLLLHFRRISRPSLGQAKEDPKAFDGSDPSRPEEVYNDMSSSSSSSPSSSSSSDTDEDNNQSSGDGGGRESSLFSDLNRWSCDA